MGQEGYTCKECGEIHNELEVELKDDGLATMKVTLVRSTELEVCSDAIRECHNTKSKRDGGGHKDKSLIHRVGNQHKHGSTLEHLTYTFQIDGISRAVLQEIS